jgi:hypothetical protein
MYGRDVNKCVQAKEEQTLERSDLFDFQGTLFGASAST